MQPIAAFILILIFLAVFVFFEQKKETENIPELPEEENISSVPPTRTQESEIQEPSLPTESEEKETAQTNISPYSEKIKISSVSQYSIILTSYLEKGEKINITGWQLKGRNGEITIPQGQELLIPGSSMPKKDIFLKEYDEINFQSDSDPFKTNVIFRPNQCFGYLMSSYDAPFPFSYSKICPSIDPMEVCNFSEDCQDFIFSLESCEPIDYSGYLSIVYDSDCQLYIDNYIARNLNYGGCIENYYKDEIFFGDSWYYFVGRDITCRCGDTIYLYDKNGLEVDNYYYENY